MVGTSPLKVGASLLKVGASLPMVGTSLLKVGASLLLVAALVAVTACSGGRDDRARARRPMPPHALDVTVATSTTVATVPTTIGPVPGRDVPLPSNVPMTPLQPGQRPPQFVLFSFDGAGDHEAWQEFTAGAATVNARFTGFLTGTYLLTDAARGAYTGPDHKPGAASVSFGGSPDRVQTLVDDLNRAWLAGHEIGTHYNGHFCNGAGASGDDWSTQDWDSEIGQFGNLWQNWAAIDGIANPRPLLVPLSAVRGGRTPCLEGRWEQLQGAWQAAGYTYDSSIPGTGIAWPRIEYGVWEFHMPYIQSPALGGVTAMDYNFWVKFNGGREQPERGPELGAKVLDTYRHMYDVAFTTTRAPVVIANHFNTWNGDAFNPAALAFMTETCARPETICATYSDVIAWMGVQDPAVLAALQAQPPVT